MVPKHSVVFVGINECPLRVEYDVLSDMFNEPLTSNYKKTAAFMFVINH